MVFKDTFKNISIGGSVLFVEETEYPEKTTEPPQETDKLLSYIVLSSTPRTSWVLTHNVSILLHIILGKGFYNRPNPISLIFLSFLCSDAFLIIILVNTLRMRSYVKPI